MPLDKNNWFKEKRYLNTENTDNSEFDALLNGMFFKKKVCGTQTNNELFTYGSHIFKSESKSNKKNSYNDLFVDDYYSNTTNKNFFLNQNSGAGSATAKNYGGLFCYNSMTKVDGYSSGNNSKMENNNSS